MNPRSADVVTTMMNAQQESTGSAGANLTILPVLALILAFAMPAFADERSQAPAFGILLPTGVLTDFDRQDQVFLMEPEGLSSRSMESGELLWQNPEATRPLGLAAGQLIVLAEIEEMDNRIPLLMLDPDSGLIRQRLFIDLPEDVLFLIDEKPNRRFEVWLNQSESGVVLEWWSEYRDLRGAPAVSGATREAKMPRTVLEAGDSTAAEEAPMGEIWRQQRTGRVLLDLDGGRVAAEAELDPELARPLLIPNLSDAERVAQLSGDQFRDAGDSVVMASQRVADARSWARHEWTVLDRSSEEVLGSFRHYSAYSPFLVSGARLGLIAQPYFRVNEDGYFEERPLTFEVWQLPGQSLAWTATLRDTAYRDTMPP